MDAQSAGEVDQGVVFLFRDGAVQLGVVLQAQRGELAHNADIDAVPVGLVQVGKHPLGILYMPGKEQVADDDALLQHAVTSPLQGRLLAEHFQKGGFCHGGVIGGAGIFLCQQGGHILEVGQIDVHQSLHETQRVYRFVAAAIHHEGQGEAPPFGVADSLCYLRQVGIRGDQVDIMDAGGGEAEEEGGQFFRGDALPRFAVGDSAVLAIDALQLTSGKEDGSRAVFPREAGFFPQVGSGAGNLDKVGSSAEADIFFAVRHAAAGAKGTFHGVPPTCFFQYNKEERNLSRKMR